MMCESDLFSVWRKQRGHVRAGLCYQVLDFAGQLSESLGLAQNELRAVINEIAVEVEETAESFMVNVASPRSYVEILEEAHMELGRMNLSGLMAANSPKSLSK